MRYKRACFRESRLNYTTQEVQMKVGTVKEIKRHEYRIGLTPACVKAYVRRGHEVLVEDRHAGPADTDSSAIGGGRFVALLRM